jgi:ADP-ribose pyrophosphatase YjhB (NUDIX family)
LFAPTLSVQLKQRLATVMRWWPLRRLLTVAVRLFAPTHRIGVGVVLLDDHGRVLLLKHVFHPTMPWGLPGGWLDRGEDPLAGAKRELREETGVTTAVFGPLIHLRRDNPPDHIGMAYVAQVPTTSPATMTLSNEITAADWFPADNIPRPFSTFGREAITAAMAHLAHQQQPGNPGSKI